MRLLFLNKYLYPKGGSEVHMFDVADRLEQVLGSDHFYFGTSDERNQTPVARTTTIESFNYQSMAGIRNKFSAVRSMVYNSVAYDAVRTLADKNSFDLAHAHNIYHQLSPSVLTALRECGVPVVLTAHDYKLVCPSYSLHDGEHECFRCKGGKYWNIVRTGCSRKGFLGSMALTIEATVHKMMKIYERCIDQVVAPSQFLADRLVEGGFPKNKIQVLHNAIDVQAFTPGSGNGNYALFLGRLSYEKGLPTLLQAARHAKGVPLVVAGDGPLKAELEAAARDCSHIEFVGRVNKQEACKLLQNCRFAVLPSAVPENCPLSVLESFATARPVIASRIGGIPELVIPGETGELIDPGDAKQLSTRMTELWNDKDICTRLGELGRDRVVRHHDMAGYIQRLLDIYQNVLGRVDCDITQKEVER